MAVPAALQGPIHPTTIPFKRSNIPQTHTNHPTVNKAQLFQSGVSEFDAMDIDNTEDTRSTKRSAPDIDSSQTRNVRIRLLADPDAAANSNATQTVEPSNSRSFLFSSPSAAAPRRHPHPIPRPLSPLEPEIVISGDTAQIQHWINNATAAFERVREQLATERQKHLWLASFSSHAPQVPFEFPDSVKRDLLRISVSLDSAGIALRNKQIRDPDRTNESEMEMLRGEVEGLKDLVDSVFTGTLR